LALLKNSARQLNTLVNFDSAQPLSNGQLLVGANMLASGVLIDPA
jgi:hypothetical protein